ncbi:hypothetical protein GCG54_00005567 [Colletotrichum gloeosporioides]|uniref:Heterokaryon incompatibility domain-containing protein n=1 Tax=Colletotrichum gloeosporioides TaxID=474922 RepID=A0A8H4FGW6_COLGL|nr:uncharacterized protein GCG54_00005567 [Colletotrichum gloeosporioides]KAF3801411.1 hypothetical protein GCG54_00005567 [Colletotrichum gloeosporioides]
MSNLQRPNSLDDPAITTQLAPMVRQAIALTSSVGQRYLWVDTLCIDHSRIAESTTQLQNMGAIYANASLTIVALDRDAEDGFPGLRDISQEKDRDDEVPIQFGNEEFILDKLSYFGLTLWSMYHERGWTFQEFNMSPRRLIFSKDSLHWMCQCSVWEEHLHHGVEAGKYLNPRMGEIMRGMPNIRSLSNLIGYYNDMKLSYDEDCLPGMTGLLTVFSRCFSGGFLCGIPEMFLETALSWQPTWYHTDLRRRVHSDRFDTSQLHPCLLPSWSWIGWEGLVDIGSLEAGPANPSTWNIRETIPITTWYARGSPKTGQKRKIKATWYENRELYKDFERPLPPGWTRHVIPKVTNPGYGDERDGNVLLYPDGCDESTFRHRNMTEHREEHDWHWPFPVPDIDESTQPYMPEQTPYLCCDTRRAFVFAFQAGDDNDITRYKSGQYNKVELYNKKQVVVGSLHLHNKQQLEHFPPPESDWAMAKEIELIAICRARGYKQTFDDSIGCYTAPFTSWDVYSVLWVEWIDGVAHRLACGEVDKTAWEELALEDVSLILG